MNQPDRIRITISEEYVERDGHLIPRCRRIRCARFERWMTVDQSIARQYCPHCEEAVVLDIP
jgi:hypothetical protein